MGVLVCGFLPYGLPAPNMNITENSIKSNNVVIELPGGQAFVLIADNPFGVMSALRKGFPLGNLGDHNP